MYPPEVVKNTLVDYPRLESLEQLVVAANEVGGEMAEVGVYKGGTAALIRMYASEFTRLFLFDTFTGLPQVDKSIDTHHEGDFKDTSLKQVDLLLTEIVGPYALYKGIFPRENAQYVEHLKFSLVHLDVDIYPSVLECLTFFAPRMSKGGVIVLDDYNAPSCPGAKKAADEYALANSLIIEPTVQSQAIIRF